MAFLVVLVAGILFATLWGMTAYFSNKVDEVKAKGTTEEELLRYRTIDELVKKLQDLSDSGEVTYFSMSDIRKVADEMKDLK